MSLRVLWQAQKSCNTKLHSGLVLVEKEAFRSGRKIWDFLSEEEASSGWSFHLDMRTGRKAEQGFGVKDFQDAPPPIHRGLEEWQNHLTPSWNINGAEYLATGNIGKGRGPNISGLGWNAENITQNIYIKMEYVFLYIWSYIYRRKWPWRK